MMAHSSKIIPYAKKAPCSVGTRQAEPIIRKRHNRLGPEISGKLLYLKMNWDKVLKLNLNESIVENGIEID